MQISITDFDRFKIIKLSGEVDLHNSRDVKKILMKNIEDLVHLLIDFTELEYIDSSGMATLVEALNLSKTKQLDFHIIGAKDAPLQVLQLTRLDSVFSLLQTAEQARS
ncbi:MAG: anti-sigma B factor antagonist [Paraglaciecola sp.]|jgi:anti-sigma B factor antagonist